MRRGAMPPGYAPKIVDGYKSLKASGAVEDDWLSNLPKMRKVQSSETG